MSDDNELEALRAKRLAELQQKYGNQQGGQNQSQEANDKKAKEDELRNSILSQVLSQEARSRLSTLSVAKPEKAKLVENLLINNARMGIIRGKLSESDLIDLLEKVSQQTTKQTTVKFDRRRTALDDSDED